MCNTVKFNCSNSGTRNEVRMRVVNEFSTEIPGQGNGNLASKYRYYVETLDYGNNIILNRPANLKNGFDFLIRVENYVFSNGRDYPKHEDILEDLRVKKLVNEDKYNNLFQLLNRVYNCDEIETSDYENLDFEVGYSVELILKVCKWFFIEQDIRYWNYLGRGMLMNVITSI